MSVAANNILAAAFSVVISASLFAYAIIPASPSVMV
ncbi:MAG: enoyl-CoA hydratase [Pseudomonadota bacterium]